MKTKILFSIIFLTLVSSFLSAQSDYQTLQNFKKQYKQIEESIKGTSSLEDYNSIGDKIANLRNDFTANKSMLDKALYPENFESSFAKLENEIESKKKDLGQISTLTTQVSSLKNQVSELNQKNEELIKQIDDLKTEVDKDDATINELKRLVGILKSNINKRDVLVRDLVDSLLVEFIKSPQNISQREAKTIASKVKKENLFYNIERTIEDNIQFTKVTQMTADDFARMKKQCQDFNTVWKRVGPRLSAVYLSTKQKRSEIPQIDSLFVLWNNQIDNEIWKNINNLFSAKNINLAQFNNADEFVNSVSTFIDSEVKNLDVKSHDESSHDFSVFAKEVYFSSVETKWIPILIKNGMMTSAQQTLIDNKIETWGSKVSSSTPYWLFAVGGIVVLIAVFFLLKRSKKQIIKTNSIPA